MDDQTTTQTTQTARTGTPGLWLTLQARDAPALIDWCCRVLGFRLTARHDEGTDVAHAELLWSEGVGGVMLGSHHADRPFTIAPGSGNAYLVTSDPDAVHARAVAAGAEVVREPGGTDYGSRELALRDPEGNVWSLGTYPGQPG